MLFNLKAILSFLFLFILASHVQATTEVEKVYATADAFFSQKKYEEAINVYLNIVANFHQDAAKAYFMIGRYYSLPMDDSWYDMVGRCYEQTGKMGKTIEALSPVSSKYTKLPPIGKENAAQLRGHYWKIAHDVSEPAELRELALYRIAESYLAQGRYSSAIPIFLKIYEFLKIYKRSTFYKDAGLMIGRCYFEAGEYNKATEWLEKDISRYGHPFPIFYQYLGLSYYYQTNYQKVIELFGKYYLDVYPNEPLPLECRYRLADSLYNLNRYDEALKEFERILEDFPQSRRRIQALMRVTQIKEIKKRKEK